MRMTRHQPFLPLWRSQLRSLRQTIDRETHRYRRGRDREHLRHIRLSRLEWWTMVLLLLGMFLAMCLGAYLGGRFKGRVMEIGIMDIDR